MKSAVRARLTNVLWSLPVRGAWIEMLLARCAKHVIQSLPVRGAWIEMSRARCAISSRARRSPCGERGLK